jgi:hypothetical protein
MEVRPTFRVRTPPSGRRIGILKRGRREVESTHSPRYRAVFHLLAAAAAALLLAAACDDGTSRPQPQTAVYRLAFDATWSADTHPTDFPSNAHFSGLIGAAHVAGVHLWEVGEPSSPGIKNMAERGLKEPLGSEVDTLIAHGEACSKLSGGGINPSPGSVQLELTMDRDCPSVSVVSMIAPSPDWFVGVSDVLLFEHGRWVDEKVIDLLPYDAGTDSGVTFLSPDLVTEPPVPIQEIVSDPLLVGEAVPPLGTFTFTRVEDQ